MCLQADASAGELDALSVKLGEPLTRKLASGKRCLYNSLSMRTNVLMNIYGCEIVRSSRFGGFARKAEDFAL
jgi:hypothetical protein